jgi:hypothetical protein
MEESRLFSPTPFHCQEVSTVYNKPQFKKNIISKEFRT